MARVVRGAPLAEPLNPHVNEAACRGRAGCTAGGGGAPAREVRLLTVARVRGGSALLAARCRAPPHRGLMWKKLGFEREQIVDRLAPADQGRLAAATSTAAGRGTALYVELIANV